MSSINSLDTGLIVPSFTFSLNQSIIPGCVCSGRFGGTLLQSSSSSSSSSSSLLTANSSLPTSPSSSTSSLGVDIVTLACATSGGRIILHDGATAQNINNTYNSNIRYLNINRSITALTCARLPLSSVSFPSTTTTTEGISTHPNGYAHGSSSTYSSSLVSISSGPQVNSLSLTTDLLLIGTSGSIQAYNVDTNTDLFFKDTSEAVTAVIAGNWSMMNNDDLGIPTGSSNTMRKLSGSSTGTTIEKTLPLCIAGGNCTLTGYDVEGNERLWGVTGDVVTSLALADVDGDGLPELLVGTADADIRCLRGKDFDCIAETTEGDIIRCIADINCPPTTNSSTPSTGSTMPGPSTLSIPLPTLPTTVNSKSGSSTASDSGNTNDTNTNGVNSNQKIPVRMWAYGLANGTVGVYSSGTMMMNTTNNTSTKSVPNTTSNSGSTTYTRNTSSFSDNDPTKSSSLSHRDSFSSVNSTASIVPNVIFSRLWRLKAKGTTTAIVGFDFDKDGQAEVVCGWSTGRIEIRKAITGELLFRDTFASGAGIAGFTVCDYRGDGRPVLICVSTDGEVRGYSQVDNNTLYAHRKAAGLLTAAAISAAAATVNTTSRTSTNATNSTTGKPPTKPKDTLPEPLSANAGTGTTTDNDESDLLMALSEKAKLEQELRLLQQQITVLGNKDTTSNSSSTSVSSLESSNLVLPTDTKLDIKIGYNIALKCIEFIVTTTTVKSLPLSIRAVTLTAPDSKIFPTGREAIVVVPPPLQTTQTVNNQVRDVTTLTVPFHSKLDTNVTLRFQALVGERANSLSFAVLETLLTLPKFSMFMLLPSVSVPSLMNPQTMNTVRTTKNGLVLLPPSLPLPSPSVPKCTVLFTLPERASRLAMWITSSFLVPENSVTPIDTSSFYNNNNNGINQPSTELLEGNGTASLALDVRFAYVRDTNTNNNNGGGSSVPQMLRIAVTTEHGGYTVIQGTDMETVGNILQDMGNALGISTLESTATFPTDMDTIRNAIERLAEANAIRTKLTGEMAETVGIIKGNIVQAEDARLRCQMKEVRTLFMQLKGIQNDLLREYKKRTVNHETLLESLRVINSAINKAANLRMGEPKTRIVDACRQAIKTNNFQALLTIMTTGKP